MPINENTSFTHYSDSNSSANMMSKAELRKTHKPIMEKKRRAKINNCLNEIKSLVLLAMKKDPERHSKLEKADILEMAVKHLQTVQHQQRDVAIRTDPAIAHKYQTGYAECMSEVTDYVHQIPGIDDGLKQRIKSHLGKCMTGLDQTVASANNTVARHLLTGSSSSLLASFAAARNRAEDLNNNPTFNGVELIPSCLPNGEFAFLVPKSSYLPPVIDVDSSSDDSQSVIRTSAFATVLPSTIKNYTRTLPSPPISPSSSDDVTFAINRSPSPPPTSYTKVTKPIAKKIQQVVQVTSSTTTKPEIHHMKFPIHNSQATGKREEPLCIITNQGERHRLAQQLPTSRHCAENIYSGGGKRAREGIFPAEGSSSGGGGLLTFASELPAKKRLKFEQKQGKVVVLTKRGRDESVDEEQPSCSSTDNNRGANNSGGDSMWRPW